MRSYRSVRMTGAAKFAEMIGQRIERRSQTGSFVLAALIGSRGAHGTVSNFHSDKGGGFFFRRAGRDELRLPR